MSPKIIGNQSVGAKCFGKILKHLATIFIYRNGVIHEKR